MATTGIIDGTIIKVYVGGVAVAHSTSARIEFEKDTLNETTKDSGSWEDLGSSRKRVTFSGDFLNAEDAAYGFDDLYGVLNGVLDPVLRMSSEENGDRIYEATCVLTALSRDAPLDDVTSGAFTFKTTGPVMETVLSALPDLSVHGNLIAYSGDYKTTLTLNGSKVESINMPGDLGGLELVKASDLARPDFLEGVPGVLNAKDRIRMHSAAKLTGAVPLRNRPAVWFAVVARVLDFEIGGAGASLGNDVTITLSDALGVKANAGAQWRIMNSSKTAQVATFTFSNDYEIGATSVVGDLSADISAGAYLTTRSSTSTRILRTDGSIKDYLLDGSAGGPQPTHREFQSLDAGNTTLDDNTNNSSTDNFYVICLFAPDTEENVLIVNGVEVDRKVTDAPLQIGGAFSLGGTTSGVVGSFNGDVSLWGWYDDDFNSLDLAGLQEDLADYRGAV